MDARKRKRVVQDLGQEERGKDHSPTHEALYGTTWYACVVVREVPAGTKVLFTEDRSTMLIPTPDTPTHLRALPLPNQPSGEEGGVANGIDSDDKDGEEEDHLGVSEEDMLEAKRALTEIAESETAEEMAKKEAKRERDRERRRAKKAAKSRSRASAASAISDGDAEILIEVQQENPKKPGSLSFERYEAYKAARTLEEMLSLGGVRGDFKHDVNKGFITVVTGHRQPQSPPPPPKAQKPKAQQQQPQQQQLLLPPPPPL